MIVVIIAGGSGSRLWPLSTPDYPKHLLQLTDSKSLLQNTYQRAHQLSDKIYIISEASHVNHVYQQLPELSKDNVIVEPGRRGTASCVIAALACIKQQSNDENEPIVFMHADHHIRDTAGFVETLKIAGEDSSHYKKLVLLGVEPTYPATGFGYIERGEHANGHQVYSVKSFKEKPDLATAQTYLASGHYLWNMGYFIAPLNVFEATIKAYSPELWHNYERLLAADNQDAFTATYLDFKSEPIDTALIEKVHDLLVVPGTFDWMDVGSFPDVHQVSPQNNDGNTLKGNVQVEEVINSYIRNETDVPVAVIGLDNVTVVNTPHGLLVANKSYAQRVGEVSKRFKQS